MRIPLLPGPGFLVHHLLGVGFQPQGDGGQRVGEQVDEQQVHRLEGHGQGQQGGIQHRENPRHVPRQQKLNGPADVGIDVPAVLHRLHNGGEIVVYEHHVGGVLGHVCAGDAHGHTDVRLLQGGGVVDPVSGHGHQGPRSCQARTIRILCSGDTRA